MLLIDFNFNKSRVELSWSIAEIEKDWLQRTLTALQTATEDSLHWETGRRITLPLWKFLQARGSIVSIWNAANLDTGEDLVITDNMLGVLKQSRQQDELYSLSGETQPVPEADLLERLLDSGFVRQLTAEQTRNVAKLVRFPFGATFSVPGAGKTTEALAYFFYRANHSDSLLVIAPKNAFAAWDEQLSLGVGQTAHFARLRGGAAKIMPVLEREPRFAIITYEQLISVADLIREHLTRHNTFLFLDESHRIKAGEGKVTADTVLSLAHLPVGKLILSGTPLPNSMKDIVPQFQFLLPSHQTDHTRVADDIQHLFTRTTKNELGLKPIRKFDVSLSMTESQRAAYALLRSEARRQAAGLTSQEIRDYRAIGRSIMRLLQFCSEPLLLAESLDEQESELFAELFSEGDSPKMEYLLRRVRSLNNAGHKVLVWSSFKRNVEYVAERLSDKGAVYIHGDVDSGSDELDDTREGKIKRFLEDDDVGVLVANPAAAGEGISLHSKCHHAIYLDRTFNAAHFLQSQDRIHRLGLSPDQNTSVEILQYQDSIDSVVENSLDRKISAMFRVLRDDSLQVEEVPVFDEQVTTESDEGSGIDSQDIEDFVRELFNKK